jgi:hypothetical protein
MAEFSGIDLTAARPPGVCDECMKDGLQHAQTGFEAVYCRHRGLGVWRVLRGYWRMAFVSLDAFRSGILLGIAEGENGVMEQKEGTCN